MKKLGLIFISGVLASSLMAQETKSPPIPPEDPIIQKRAQSMAAWTITATAKGDDEASSSASPLADGPKATRNSVTTITKTNSILRQSTTDDRKQVWEIWYFGKEAIMLYPNKKDILSRGASIYNNDQTFSDYSTTDFPDFSWIKSYCYLGTKQFDGKSCFAFKGQRDVNATSIVPVKTKSSSPKDTSDNLTPEPVPVVPAENAGPEKLPILSPIVYIAYIDSKSRLPIALKTSTSTRVYEFQAPPALTLELPDAIAKAVNKARAVAKETLRPPVSPF